MQVLDTSSVWTGATAAKTKGLKAKPLSSVIADTTFIGKLLVETLEGIGPLKMERLVCLGELGDLWLQEDQKIIKKYDLVAITADGWLDFVPKKDAVDPEYFIVTQEMIDSGATHIQGIWGVEIDGVVNLQPIKAGDAVCRQPYEHADQWVVAKKIWDNSYTPKG